MVYFVLVNLPLEKQDFKTLKNKKQISIILFTLILGFTLIFAIYLYFLNINNSNRVNFCGTKDKEPINFCGTKSSSIIGKTIFNTNCAACHKINWSDDIIKKKYTTYQDSTYFERYIKNEDSLTNKNDKNVKSINEMFKGDFNHNFKTFSKKDIRELKIYIESHLVN